VTWPDPYEGYLYKLFEAPEKTRKAITDLENLLPGKLEAILDYLLKVYVSSYFTFAKCWSLERNERHELWEVYSHEKSSIRISTTIEKLQSSLVDHLNADEYELLTNRVEYDLDDNFDIKSQIHINDNGKKEFQTFEMLFHKRPAFNFEHEVRLIIYDKSAFDWKMRQEKIVKAYNRKDKDYSNHLIELFENITKEEIVYSDKKNVNEYVNIPCKDKIIVTHNNLDWIESILIHPLANEVIRYFVKKLCKEERISVNPIESRFYKLPWQE
jgi:hypothetical protein